MNVSSAELTESTCGWRIRRKQMKIMGGTVATVESHPWVAAILSHKSKEKVGTQAAYWIHRGWDLTLDQSQGCIYTERSHQKTRRFSVVLGKNALNESKSNMEQTFGVEQIIVLEDFDNTDGNDIGLWFRSHYLREAQVNIISDDVCRQEDYYGNLITNNMFCAGWPDWSRDACEGDSGGQGVRSTAGSSYSGSSAGEFRPDVYTRVTNCLCWIEEKIHGRSTFPQK